MRKKEKAYVNETKLERTHARFARPETRSHPRDIAERGDLHVETMVAKEADAARACIGDFRSTAKTVRREACRTESSDKT